MARWLRATVSIKRGEVRTAKPHAPLVLRNVFAPFVEDAMFTAALFPAPIDLG